MKKGICIVIAVFLLLSLAQCSLKAPEVRVTGEMTALEKEVLGTYRQVKEDDTWMVASTRSEGKAQTEELSPEKKRVLKAMQDQKFNKDDIDEFKQKGYVGENNQGFLSIREHEDLNADDTKMKFVEKIVTEENSAREVIMDRVIELNDTLKNAVRENVMTIFAQMNQDNSPAGTWIQEKLGDWIRK
ncbi:DUF1318 domain-containing protein [bacterium]|nr:DUF1318 domain-containing protein [bacterium]